MKETEDASPTPQMLLPLCKLTFRSYRTASNPDFEGLALCVGQPTHLTYLLCPLPFYFCVFEPFSGGTNADVEMLEGQGGQKKQTSRGDCLPGGTAQESELFYKEKFELSKNYKIGQAMRAAYSKRAERKADKVEAHPVHSRNGCCSRRGEQC